MAIIQRLVPQAVPLAQEIGIQLAVLEHVQTVVLILVAVIQSVEPNTDLVHITIIVVAPLRIKRLAVVRLVDMQ
jgi:2-polyprenyl-3-methyl-5-hydroxy-6-metoxy-1,4-benzoquinol methylase